MHREADDNEREARPDLRDAGGRNIIEIIRTMRAELRKSDRKVADVVLNESPANPEGYSG